VSSADFLSGSKFSLKSPNLTGGSCIDYLRPEYVMRHTLRLNPLF